MIAALPSSKWPAEEWILRLLECGLLNKPQPIQLALSFEGPLEVRSDGLKICGDCQLAPVLSRGHRRCGRCYHEYKRSYWHLRYFTRKAAATGGVEGAPHGC